jgi:hypothetical protein
LAELDRAIIHYYPQLGKNKQAIMRAYKAADASGVRENIYDIDFYLKKIILF